MPAGNGLGGFLVALAACIIILSGRSVDMHRIVNFFIPRETKFFDLLSRQSETVVETAHEFAKLVKKYDSLSEQKRAQRVTRIRKLESRGDTQSGEILDLLNKSLVTPFDREDIHALTVALDDMVDILDESTHRLVLYKVKQTPLLLQKQADVLFDMAQSVQQAIQDLPRLATLKGHCRELYRFEHKGDEMYETAMTELFDVQAQNHQVLEIIKFKDLYEDIEAIFNKGKDLADIIQSIVVKHG